MKRTKPVSLVSGQAYVPALKPVLIFWKTGIPIRDRGKGRQCFIKTEFALRQREQHKEMDALLPEEPENHLSHVNMKKL